MLAHHLLAADTHRCWRFASTFFRHSCYWHHEAFFRDMNVLEAFQTIHETKAKRTRALALAKGAPRDTTKSSYQSGTSKKMGTKRLLQSPDKLYRPPNTAVKRWHEDYDARWEALQKVLSEHEPNVPHHQPTSPMRAVAAG